MLLCLIVARSLLSGGHTHDPNMKSKLRAYGPDLLLRWTRGKRRRMASTACRSIPSIKPRRGREADAHACSLVTREVLSCDDAMAKLFSSHLDWFALLPCGRERLNHIYTTIVRVSTHPSRFIHACCRAPFQPAERAAEASTRKSWQRNASRRVASALLVASEQHQHAPPTAFHRPS